MFAGYLSGGELVDGMSRDARPGCDVFGAAFDVVGVVVGGVAGEGRERNVVVAKASRRVKPNRQSARLGRHVISWRTSSLLLHCEAPTDSRAGQSFF